MGSSAEGKTKTVEGRHQCGVSGCGKWTAFGSIGAPGDTLVRRHRTEPRTPAARTQTRHRLKRIAAGHFGDLMRCRRLIRLAPHGKIDNAVVPNIRRANRVGCDASGT